MRKKILIIYGSAGGGHKAVAQACAQALILKGINQEDLLVLDAVDFTTYTGKKLNKLYLHAAAYNHSLWFFCYYVMQLRFLLRLLNSFVLGAHKFITQQIVPFKPDIIISTHQLSSELLAHARRNHVIFCPVMTVITDPFTTHASWEYKGTDYYWCSSDITQKFLLRNGVDKKHIKMGGMPCSQEHTQSSDALVLRKKFGIAQGQFVVLIFNWGSTPQSIRALINSLNQYSEKVTCLVVCGTNDYLYQQLAATQFELPVMLHKYVHNMHELMAVADLLVSKAGPSTLAEALLHGLPIAIMQPLMPQEVPNKDYVLAQKLGHMINSPQDLTAIVAEFLQNPASLSAAKERSLSFAQPTAAVDLADYIMSILQT